MTKLLTREAAKIFALGWERGYEAGTARAVKGAEKDKAKLTYAHKRITKLSKELARRRAGSTVEGSPT